MQKLSGAAREATKKGFNDAYRDLNGAYDNAAVELKRVLHAAKR